MYICIFIYMDDSNKVVQLLREIIFLRVNYEFNVYRLKIVLDLSSTVVVSG